LRSDLFSRKKVGKRGFFAAKMAVLSTLITISKNERNANQFSPDFFFEAEF